MSLPDPLPITPFTRPVRGEVVLPGSKSITNRALILAALGSGTTTLRGALFSRDSRIMIAALRQLGFAVETDEQALTIRITGRNGEIPVREATIDVGNAGTAARFLTAFVCLRPDGVYHFDGDEAMRRRPIGALLEALESQGAKASSRSFPFTLYTAGLPGGLVSLDASESSQMLSALLMAGKHARSPLTVKLQGEVGSKPFVVMTEAMLQQFVTQPADYAIEGDASAGSYFLALPLVVGGEIHLTNYSGELQGDIRFLDVLLNVGLFSEQRNGLSTYCWDKNGERLGLNFNFRPFSDTFLTLAAIAPLLKGPTRITGIAHTRKQETDRVAGMTSELRKIIGFHNVIEAHDSIEIHPAPMDQIRANSLKNGPIEIETYHDHRFAMSFGILGCHDLHGDGRPWLSIKDPSCCAKTFPNFFELLESLRQKSLAS